MKRLTLGPKTKKEKVTFSVESLRLDLQCLLNRSIIERKLDDHSFAKKLGVPRKKVKQMFSGSWNPTMSRIAKVFHSLGYSIDITLKEVK